MRKDNMSSYKILHLSTSCLRGAGIATNSLHEYLLKYGFESFLYVFENTLFSLWCHKLAEVRKRLIPDKYWNLIKKTLRRNKNINTKYVMHSIDDYCLPDKSKAILRNIPFEPDIVLIHWVAGFMNAESISSLYKTLNKPIYWLLLDNAPLTGGCHYPWDCLGYTKKCGNCPGLYSNDTKDKTFLNMQNKSAYLKNIDISVICFSEEDFQRAGKSSLFKEKNKFKLFLPVDEKIFHPLESKNIGKNKLGIDENKLVVLLGASNIQDKRKGLELFYQAWKDIKVDKIVLLVIGKADNECLESLGEAVRYLGTVNEKDLITCYQAADFFVCPTIEDSGPYMINQSLMCGTPVVSFNIGVSIDFVRTGVSGYNCGCPSVFSLKKGIEYMLERSTEQRSIMNENCREFALKNLCIDKFVSDFKNILVRYQNYQD